jgi:hypothetical protein
MEQNTNPILSCAGRKAETIDSALLTELLLSFTPNTIGIREKAKQVSNDLRYLADGGYGNGNESLERFKVIITTEFLSVQLMEASKLARQASEEAKQASSIDTM